MLHYFIVALYQCCTCSYCAINAALFCFAPFNVALYYYINIVLLYVALLMLSYFNSALFDVVLFNIELLNVVLL